MARFDFLPPDSLIATAILAAPGWARVGITMPDERLRERAAHELARAIVTGAGIDADDPNQLPLAL